MYNNTTKYIVPLLKLNRNIIITRNFINAYLLWDDVPEEKDCLFLYYTSLEGIRIPRYESRKTFVTKKGVIVIVDLAKGLTDEISKITNGYFTQLNKEIKERLLEFWNSKNNSFLYNLLNTEMSSIANKAKLNIKKEILRTRN